MIETCTMTNADPPDLPSAAERALPIDRDKISTYSFLAFWLHRLSAEVIKRFEVALGDYGVTVAQWNILLLLHRYEANSPRMISDLAGIDAGAVSRAIDRLSSKGLVERIYDQEDGRSVRIALTQAGEAVIVPTLEIAIEQDLYWTEAMEGLSRQNMAQIFRDLLVKDPIKKYLNPDEIIDVNDK